MGFDLFSAIRSERLWLWAEFKPCVLFAAGAGGGGNDVQWCFSQVKGAIDDDVAEGKCLLSFLTFKCVEVIIIIFIFFKRK